MVFFIDPSQIVAYFDESIIQVVKLISNGLLFSKSMNNKNSKPTSRQNTNQQGLIVDNPSSLAEYLSDRISLKMLEFLEVQMQPHAKNFNIIEIALLADKFIDERVLKFSKQPSQKQLISATVPFQKPPKLQKVTSSGQARSLQLQKQQIFHLLLQQLKKVFLFYSTTSLCYEMLNEYVYNQQLTILSNEQVDEDYMEIGEKRVRIDENLKLCIMPLIEEQSKVKSTKIRELVFRQNAKGSQLESIYAVTNQYIRCIRIKPELIGIASDFNKNGANNFCWYHFEKEVISPKRNTISVLSKSDENPILSSAELKQLKATTATNLQEMFSDQLLSILKASLGDKMMGMISLDQSFIVQPISSPKGKVTQGYIGNLMRDIPPQIAIIDNSKEKYQEILLFHAYSDTQWLILTDKFLYFYRIPHPSENIILKRQNNLNRAKNFMQNPLLLLCQRLPSGCIKAMVLNKYFVCLMMKNNSLIIIKVIINSVGIFEGKALNIALNYYKITNKIYNDIQFRTMSFNSTYNSIFASDFGAYLIKMSFNKGYGDIQQQGITYNKAQSSNLNQQMMKNSYNELKVSRNGAKRSKVIHEVDGEDDNQEDEEYIQVYYIKSNKNNEKNIFSIYKKQNNSPHTVVIKNKTRQIITFLATNHNYNTLVTYQSQSYQKISGTDFDGQKYRQWGNNNKIKLWDIRHMTIYKTYDISVEIAFLQLRANGLFAVTTDRGYLVYYPFNEDRKAMISQSQQKQLDIKSREVTQQLQDLFLHKNCLYFSTLTTRYNKYSNLKIQKTHIYQLKLQKIPQIKIFQILPSQATALALNSRLYILQNSTQGVEASHLHIYNKAGLKQDIMIFSNLENVGLDGKINTQYYNQQYKFLKKIEHSQFEVVLWNTDAMKLIGVNRQSSYTVVFSSHKVNNFGEGIERIRNIKDIQIIGQIMIVYCDNTIRIKQKATHLQTNSKLSGSTQRRSHSKQKISKVHEHFQSSVILFNNQNDRISFRLEHISSKLKVLHMYNSLLLTKQDSNDYDLIKLLDVGQSGSLLQKTLFAVKYKRVVVEKVRAGDLKDSDFYQIEDHKNIILQENKQYSVKHMITLEDTIVAITQTNKLIVLLIFKVQVHYSDIITKKVVRSQLQFMIYARNISDQLFNNNYKISKIQVGKKTQKHLYEYQTSTTRTENIFGHKLLTIDDCFNISNYSEIDMQGLCDIMESQEAEKYSGIDITQKILAPKHINTNRVKDIYQILSLRKDQKLFSIFQKQSNSINAINSFTFKIIQFSDDDLKGVISISNKLMKTIALYSFQIDCIKQTNLKSQQMYEPYRLQLTLSKISLLQVKSHRQIKMQEQLKRSDPQLSKKQIHHVKIHQWDEQYKSEVEQMWQNTLMNIQKFIYMQKLTNSQNKRSISLPPININKLNTIKIKKKELLRKKLSTSQRATGNHDQFMNKMQADGASIMFKKWGISQAINMQNSVRDANNITEIKAVNRYVSKVLKSQQDTLQRVDELIKNTRQIKQSLMQSPEGRGRMKALRTQQDQYYNKRALGQDQIERIIVSSEIAKQSSIKSFIKQKAALKSTINPSKNENYKFSRNNTNKSELTSEIEKLTVNRTESRNSKMEYRATNQSKLSYNTNLTFKTFKNSENKDKGQSLNGLQYSISKRLEQIQEKSLSKNKNEEKLKFYTPQRLLKGHNLDSLKTEKSQDESQFSSDRKKTIRFSTEQSPVLARHKKDSHSQYTLKMISEEQIHSSIKKRSKKQEKFEDYKNNFTIMNHKQMNLKKEVAIAKKETDSQTTKESAIQRLKKSQQMLKEVYLPEIFANKQKLMKKMKQKHSFVKTIQSHLNESSLQTIHEGQQRRQLIRKLSQLK